MNSRSSDDAKNAETDLMNDSLTGNRFRQKSDDKAKHGDTAIKELSPVHPFGFDLGRCCVLEPLIVR